MKILSTLALMLGASLILTSCGGRYMNIDRSALSPHAAVLHDRAQAGDQSAQYELAIAYGTGSGVPRDCGKSRSLLKSAATPSGGTIWVYSPPVGNGTSGRVIPIDQGPVRPGLIDARTLLNDPAFCE